MALVLIAAMGQRAVLEGGPVEVMQLVIWAVAGWIGLFCGGRRRGLRTRLWLVGMGVVALAALARELDAHVLLNPETLGSLGVRYRADWWLDGSVPVLLKLGWLVVFGAIGVGSFGMLAASHMPLSKRFRGGALVTALLVVAVLGLVGGWATDDLLRWVLMPIHDWAIAVEETLEVIGPAAYAACLGAVALGGFGRSGRPVDSAETGATDDGV